MKTMVKIFVFYFVVVIIIPSIAVFFAKDKEKEIADTSKTISVYVSNTGKVENMPLEEYIKGVVAAEMPASFEKEALKAQAVCARSYYLSRKEGYEKNGYPEEHMGASVCTNPAHCQAYSDSDTLKKNWGDKKEEYMEKIASAVEATKGLVMTYNGSVISAVFHSASSGNTERAEDVWGYSVPYLESVKSLGEEASPKYMETVKLSINDFKNIVKEFDPSASFLEGGALTDEVTRSQAGGIKTITLGGVKMSGVEFRKIFSLNSTNAMLTKDNENVIIQTTGNGHGVGMSQYGANYLAKENKDFKEILNTYYKDIKIEVYNPPQ